VISKCFSATIFGLEAKEIEVEVHIQPNLKGFIVVGLPDTAVKESKERVKSAIMNSGFLFPDFAITVNLAPADLKKEGTLLDLPIALSILSASKQIEIKRNEKLLIVGELSLDGTLRQIKGGLSIGILAREKNINSVIIPDQNKEEVSLIKNIKVYPLKNLRDTSAFLMGKLEIEPYPSKEIPEDIKETYEEDFSDVKGQNQAKRVLEIAAAGGHHVLMIGPPGTGKSLLAKRIPTILPPLTFDEIIETTKIHSVAGLLSEENKIILHRPFRSPHNTISYAAMVGGGQIIQPGEISLAHNGVLFLDEFTEFRRDVLEALRQPLEEGIINISRVNQSISFPSKFLLVSAMNPCPCGFFGHPKKQCKCTPYQIQHYQGKISGPLLDRMDMMVEVPALSFDEIDSKARGESSKTIRERIKKARKIQSERFKDKSFKTNGEMGPKDLEEFVKLDKESKNLLKMAADKFSLSGRSIHRIQKVARTIADLEGKEEISPNHIAEALQYRFSRYFESI